MRQTYFASLLLVSLIGCGSTTVNTTDPDAAVDDPDAAIVVQNTTMDVFSFGSQLPLAGLHVLYFDVDDTLLSDEVTDATGRTNAPLPAGGTVVLMYLEDGGGEVAIAHRDVPPGSSLRFGGYGAGSDSYSTTVTFPSRPGSTAYSTRISCAKDYTQSYDPSPDTFNIYNCQPGETVDVYVDAFTDGVLAGTATLLDTPLSANLAVMGTYLNPRPLQATVSDIPVNLDNVNVSAYLQRPNRVRSYEQGSSGSPTDGQYVANLSLRDIAGSKLYSSVTLSGATKQQSIFTLGEVAPVVTISAQELAPYAQSPTFDLATKSLVWVGIGSGSAELAYGSFRVSRTGVYKYWHVVGANNGSRLKIPTLPVAYDEYNPVETDIVDNAFIQLINAGTATETIRRDPIGTLLYEFIPLEPGQRVVRSNSYE